MTCLADRQICGRTLCSWLLLHLLDVLAMCNHVAVPVGGLSSILEWPVDLRFVALCLTVAHQTCGVRDDPDEPPVQPLVTTMTFRSRWVCARTLSSAHPR